jgi:hypothetical protein
MMGGSSSSRVFSVLSTLMLREDAAFNELSFCSVPLEAGMTEEEVSEETLQGRKLSFNFNKQRIEQEQRREGIDGKRREEKKQKQQKMILRMTMKQN